jgi:hypothetical protein
VGTPKHYDLALASGVQYQVYETAPIGYRGCFAFAQMSRRTGGSHPSASLRGRLFRKEHTNNTPAPESDGSPQCGIAHYQSPISPLLSVTCQLFPDSRPSLSTRATIRTFGIRSGLLAERTPADDTPLQGGIGAIPHKKGKVDAKSYRRCRFSLHDFDFGSGSGTA